MPASAHSNVFLVVNEEFHLTAANNVGDQKSPIPGQ